MNDEREPQLYCQLKCKSIWFDSINTGWSKRTAHGHPWNEVVFRYGDLCKHIQFQWLPIADVLSNASMWFRERLNMNRHKDNSYFGLTVPRHELATVTNLIVEREKKTTKYDKTTQRNISWIINDTIDCVIHVGSGQNVWSDYDFFR